MGPVGQAATEQIKEAVEILAEASSINKQEFIEPVRMPDKRSREASREALLKAFPEQAAKEGLGKKPNWICMTFGQEIHAGKDALAKRWPPSCRDHLLQAKLYTSYPRVLVSSLARQSN